MKRIRYLALALVLIISLIINQLSQADITPVSGEFPVLVILQCYKDKDTDTTCGSTFTPTVNEKRYGLSMKDSKYYERVLFGPGIPNVRDYFLEMSYGKFTIKKAGIVGWYTAPKTEAYYWADKHDEKRTQAVRDADKDFDFAPYDKNGDGIIAADELAVVTVFAHNKDGGGFARGTDPAEIVTNDPSGCSGSTCKKVRAYVAEAYAFATFPLYAHELGHTILNLPDLYGPDPNGEWGKDPPDNKLVGNFSLMANHWRHPHIDPWEKIKLGWLTPTFVTKDGDYTIRSVESRGVGGVWVNPTAYILYDPCRGDPPKEYFIVENRWPGISYEADMLVPDGPGLPDQGLAIWHIDEKFSNLREVVDLERAHNDSEAKALWDKADGSAYDLSDSSSPHNSRWNDGTHSRIAIKNISEAGMIMKATFVVPVDDYQDLQDKITTLTAALTLLRISLVYYQVLLSAAPPSGKPAIKAKINELQKEIDKVTEELEVAKSAIKAFCTPVKPPPLIPPPLLSEPIVTVSPIIVSPICSPAISHEIDLSWRATGGMAPLAIAVRFADRGGLPLLTTNAPLDPIPLPPQGNTQYRLNMPQGGVLKVSVEVTDANGKKASSEQDVSVSSCPTPDQPSGPLSVNVSANGKQVCGENFSHELTVSWKILGGKPPADVTIELTAPDGQKETLGTDTLEGSRKYELFYPGGGSVKIKVTAKDASGSSSSAQASVQLGKCQ